jgi:VWFA-related protein
MVRTKLTSHWGEHLSYPCANGYRSYSSSCNLKGELSLAHMFQVTGRLCRFGLTSACCYWRGLAMVIAISLLWAGLGSPLLYAAAPAVNAEPVSLYVTVVYGDKLVRGLSAPNFRVFEDGQPRQFRLEAPEKPPAIALLVEYSRSSSLYFNDIAAAAQGFLNVAPQGDWLALATFSKDLEVRVDFTKNRPDMENSLSSLGPPKWREISTYDAVYEMLDRVEKLKGRHVLILIGSGFNTMSKHTLDEVRKKAQRSHVTIYCVGAGSLLRGRYAHALSNSATMQLMQAEAFMRMLANESGGEAWFPKFESAFGDVMKGVVQDMDFQYRLVYVPQVPADQKLHKIKVEAFRIVDDKRQDFKVLARTGRRF